MPRYGYLVESSIQVLGFGEKVIRLLPEQFPGQDLKLQKENFISATVASALTEWLAMHLIRLFSFANNCADACQSNRLNEIDACYNVDLWSKLSFDRDIRSVKSFLDALERWTGLCISSVYDTGSAKILLHHKPLTLYIFSTTFTSLITSHQTKESDQH